MYDFDKVIERKGTNSVKYDGEKMQDSHMIPMWVADMDFETLPEVKEALVKRASHGVLDMPHQQKVIISLSLTG